MSGCPSETLSEVNKYGIDEYLSCKYINKNITIDFLDEFLKTFINRLKLEKLSQRSKDREYIKIREYVRRLDKKYLPIKKLWVNNNILNNYNNLDIDENLEKIDIS